MVNDDMTRRYQRAAEAALDQLDWCIMYLREARKHDVARAVSRNRDHIRQRLRERPAADAARNH